MRGSHCWNAEACARVEADLVGQNDGLGGWEHNKFGGGAKRAFPLPVPHPDSFANPRFRNAITDLIDHPCAVAVRDDSWIGDFSGGALPRLDVRRIDPRHGEPDANLAGAWMRGVDVADLKDVASRAVAFVVSRFHEAPPLASR